MELILMEHNPEKYNEDQVIRKELEKKYNIKIKVEQIPAEKDAVTLRISSGDIPEILWDVPFGDYRTYVDQGVVAEIPVDWIKEYAPDYYDWIIENVGEDAFGYTDVDGKNYSKMCIRDRTCAWRRKPAPVWSSSISVQKRRCSW